MRGFSFGVNYTSLLHARFFKSYDKLGGKFLVETIKHAYYGEKVRMTQAKIEEFFNDPSHFFNP